MSVGGCCDSRRRTAPLISLFFPLPALALLFCSPCVILDGMLIRECCASLSSTDANAVHVLLCSSTGSVAVAVGTAPLPYISLSGADGDSSRGKGFPVSAKVVLARVQASLLKQGAASAGKGGGSAQVALGVLPTAFPSASGSSTQTSLLERVVTALADVDATPAGKAK